VTPMERVVVPAVILPATAPMGCSFGARKAVAAGAGLNHNYDCESKAVLTVTALTPTAKQ
jgi:hypothetical protein